MEKLEQLLMDIPPEERQEALTYYNGYFEDAGEENEESIIQELESPEKVARIIKADMGMDAEKEYTEAGFEDTRFRQHREVGGQENREFTFQEKSEAGQTTDKTTKTVLLVLLAVVTSPLWLGILGAAAGLILGAVGTLLGLLFAAAMIVLSFYIAAFVLGGVGISMFVGGGIAAGTGLCGIGLLLLAVAVLGTVCCVWLFGRFLPWLVRKFIELCGRLFYRKGRAA